MLNKAEQIERLVVKYIFFFLPTTEGNRHPWDYVEHFLTCLAGVIVIFLLAKLFGVPFKTSLIIASGTMLAIGVTKEVFDLMSGHTDMAGDMIANLLGIALAIIAVLVAAKILN